MGKLGGGGADSPVVEARSATKRRASGDEAAGGRKSSRQKRSRTIEIGGYHVNIESLSDITQSEKEFLSETHAAEEAEAASRKPSEDKKKETKETKETKKNKETKPKEAKRASKAAAAADGPRDSMSLKQLNARMQRDAEAAQSRAAQFFASHQELWEPFGGKIGPFPKAKVKDKDTGKGKATEKQARGRKQAPSTREADKTEKSPGKGEGKGKGEEAGPALMSPAMLRELQKPWPPPKKYLSLNNETCSMIAKKLEIDGEELVKLNQPQYPRLKLTSKFKSDTEVTLPIRCPAEHYRLIPSKSGDDAKHGEKEEDAGEESEEEDEDEVRDPPPSPSPPLCG